MCASEISKALLQSERDGGEEPLVEERKRTIPELGGSGRVQGGWGRMPQRARPGWKDEDP